VTGRKYGADTVPSLRSGPGYERRAKGLADFADRHGAAFRRIGLIRFDGNRVMRLDLNDHRVRTAVLPIQSQR
jgi:hypothetical protein